LSIDQFENEGRRVSYGTPDSTSQARRLLDRQMSISGVQKRVLAYLLKPRGWKPPVKRHYFMDSSEIAELCDAAERLFTREPSVLQIRAPVKIFGDLHGQFGDLMRLFDEYGSPSTAGDITYIDYLFLGDYVDRGQHSLETITLLLALKVKAVTSSPTLLAATKGSWTANKFPVFFSCSTCYKLQFYRFVWLHCSD
jgi:protein phosphatase